jgi:hypothetical protein
MNSRSREEDEEYTIEALLPVGGNVLLAAKYKAGKTTLNMNCSGRRLTGRRSSTHSRSGRSRGDPRSGTMS